MRRRTNISATSFNTNQVLRERSNFRTSSIYINKNPSLRTTSVVIRWLSYKNIILVLFLISLLSGGYTFERLGIETNLPLVFRQIRNYFAFILILITVVKSSILRQKRILLRKKLDVHFNPLLRKWVFFSTFLFFYMCFTAFWSPSFSKSVALWPDLFFLVFVVFMTKEVFRDLSPQLIDDLATLLVIIGGIYCVAGFLSPRVAGNRMAAFGGGPNVFVRVVGSAIISLVYFWNKNKNYIFAVLVLPLIAAIILSGSRGGTIAIACSSFLYIVYLLRKRPWIVLGGIMLIFLFAYIIIHSFQLAQPIIDFWRDRFYEKTFIEHYDSLRFVVFRETVDMFFSHIVKGVGLGGFSIISLTDQRYPHNLILQLAAEGGLFALFTFMFLMLLLMRRALKPKAPQHIFVGVLGSLYFIASMASGGIFDSRFMWFFFTLFMYPIVGKSCFRRSFVR